MARSSSPTSAVSAQLQNNLGVINEISGGALYPLIQVANYHIKQYWPQYWTLKSLTSDQPPTGWITIHHQEKQAEIV